MANDLDYAAQTTMNPASAAASRDASSTNVSYPQAFVESAVDAILMIDTAGIIRSVNRSGEALFGYRASELVGRNIRLLMPSLSREVHDGYLARYRKTGQKRIAGMCREVEGRRKDGSSFPADLTVSEVEVQCERRFMGTLRDLTEKKILEASLLQAQKMEAIGRLAGGVSHDFNTLLGTITGYAELLLDGLSGDGTDLSPDQARMWIERIHRAARRGAVLTRQLLAFSRQQALRPKRVDLGAVTSETADMIRRLIGEDIAFECAFDECLGAVSMDSGQLQQVLLNLAVNAADAMPTGGRLSMSWSRRVIETTIAMAGGSITPGSYAQLEVMDSGIGMDEETLVRIFEPFFTTKDTGKGTGLGLSTVFGIVQKWNGGIQVSSRLGAGTIFKIFFPEVEPSLDESSDTIERPSREECTSQVTILLVEDDTQFRELVREVLTSKGYRVIEAGSPPEAESLGDEVLAKVEVLVSDMVMPNGTGVELARSLRSRIPGLRVILMTGYSDEDLKSRELGESTADAFLEKPFAVHDLHDAIGRARARAD